MTDYNELRRAVELAALDQTSAALRDAEELLTVAGRLLEEMDEMAHLPARYYRIGTALFAVFAFAVAVVLVSPLSLSSVPPWAWLPIMLVLYYSPLRIVQIQSSMKRKARLCSLNTSKAKELLSKIEGSK